MPQPSEHVALASVETFLMNFTTFVPGITKTVSLGQAATRAVARSLAMEAFVGVAPVVVLTVLPLMTIR